jgi:hypothetical protein
MAKDLPTSLLNKVDFPTLGLPTIAKRNIKSKTYLLLKKNKRAGKDKN